MIGIATAPFGLALLFMQITFRLVFWIASSPLLEKTKDVLLFCETAITCFELMPRDAENITR